MGDLPKRKHIRLQGYDYSQNGAYFITICVKDKHRLLWGEQPNSLSETGAIVRNEITRMRDIYGNVKIDKYVIMPDHIHMIIIIGLTETEHNGRTQFAPTVSRIVKQFKGSITKQIGYSIWQKSYYDRIIRNEGEYIEIWKYIDENPQRWLNT